MIDLLPRWLATRRRTIGLVLIVGATLSRDHLRLPFVTTAAAQASPRSADPWTRARVVEPVDLVKELNNPSITSQPTIVCVGFPSLYRGGHVPRASFHGPASSPERLADLNRWAQGLPRSTNVVVYCGCCPFSECPNIRPAFTALRDMGFTRLRVPMLPNNFGTDWAGKGYSVER
jgi:thiosulfate/3-mercaptopyruvate sulfurtransferase